MKKTLIALMITSILATSLTGCGKSDEQLRMEAQAAAFQKLQADQEQAKLEEAEAEKLAAEQAAADDKELAGVITELKKGDPLVRDAYYGFNEKGDRVLHVVRDNPPQPVQPQQPQYQQGPNGQPVIINNQPAQAASSGVSETIWPLVAGAGAGMLLANAMNSGGGFDRYRDSHPGYSNRYYNDDNDYRRQRTTVVNQYHTTNVRNVKQVYKNPESPAAKAYQAQIGYKPRVVASPANRQVAQYQQPKQVAAKPLTNPQVNSYWNEKPKAQPAAQPKPAAQTNSYWGSSANTTQAAKPASSSGYSSGGSSSGYKPSASPSRSSYTPSRSASPSRSPSRR